MIVTFDQAERFNTLLAQKILVGVSPIDGWDEWTYSIIGEDAMAPLCYLEMSSPINPYSTFAEALEAGLVEAETQYLNRKN